MKSRKTIEHNALIGECTKILSIKFPPDPQLIKRRIEGLIERDYMDREWRENGEGQGGQESLQIYCLKFANKRGFGVLGFWGFAVDRLTHSIQTATRAHRDGRDEEYVVCALLHDIGDNLAPSNHADFAATLMQPFISEKNYWIVKHHGIFQGYYFFEYLGLDKNMRDKFKDHPYFNDCKEFCEKYDQNSFDPKYESLPLDFFIPMVERVFAKPKNTIYKN